MKKCSHFVTLLPVKQSQHSLLTNNMKTLSPKVSRGYSLSLAMSSHISYNGLNSFCIVFAFTCCSFHRYSSIDVGSCSAWCPQFVSGTFSRLVDVHWHPVCSGFRPFLLWRSLGLPYPDCPVCPFLYHLFFLNPLTRSVITWPHMSSLANA